MAQNIQIIVFYKSVDSYGRRTRRGYKTIEGARKWAQEMVGDAPEIGSRYAVSHDGIGKITCGAGCTLRDLFPKAFPVEDGEY